MKARNRILITTAVAGLVALTSGTGIPTASADEAKIKCEGVNACKGQGKCGGKHDNGESYSCAGNNTCKGKGWLKMTKKDCDAAKAKMNKKG